jgi:hypothetical protein
MFKPSAAKEAEIDRAYAEQLEVAARRKNPKAYSQKLRAVESRRAAESAKFVDKFSWQNSKDPLAEFKKRRKDGRIKDLGYDDVKSTRARTHARTHRALSHAHAHAHGLDVSIQRETSNLMYRYPSCTQHSHASSP